MPDLYHSTYDCEIHQKSQCIWHENTLMDFFRSQLIALGYRRGSDSGKVWQRDNRRVVICLVDDFTTCSEDWSTKVPYLFDPDTVVITDNWISCPTRYRVLKLPDSFCGIYAHRPEIRSWDPKRRFFFAAKRLDSKRMGLLLELRSRAQSQGLPMDTDIINFGCWSWEGDNSTSQGLLANWDHQWSLLDSDLKQAYEPAYHALRDHVPLLNHDWEFEQAHHCAWINLVIESYSSDTTVAFSEKIFRALTLPVPWMLWGGRYSIARLAAMGFDTLTDLVDHRYDHMVEQQTARYGDKMVDWIFDANETVKRLQTQSKNELDHRLQQAAAHNQDLLIQMRTRWPGDFARWWKDVSELI